MTWAPKGSQREHVNGAGLRVATKVANRSRRGIYPTKVVNESYSTTTSFSLIHTECLTEVGNVFFSFLPV